MAVMSFASGPTTLPRSVLAALKRDIEEWRSSGQSLLALPFTGADFAETLYEAERDLRSLIGIPSTHHVLFLQGGAFAHFSLLAMNLAGAHDHATYIDTGHWTGRAIKEAGPWVNIRIGAKGDGVSLPRPASWEISPGSAYCHYATNETADGLQYHLMPDTGAVPLVVDASADFLTRALPIERFGLLYASAQKNLGAAGLTVLIIRDDLLRRARRGTPAPFDYTRQAKEKSKVNTPTTFAVAVAARMLEWMIGEGGLEALEERSRRKSAKLYAAIDDSGYYRAPVTVADRSLVNIRFHLPTPDLDRMFLEDASANGLLHLGGHPCIGGLRANLYNGVPEAAVDTLIDFMADFQCRRG